MAFLGDDALSITTDVVKGLAIAVTKRWEFTPSEPFVGPASVGVSIAFKANDGGPSVEVAGDFTAQLRLSFLESPIVTLQLGVRGQPPLALRKPLCFLRGMQQKGPPTVKPARARRPRAHSICLIRVACCRSLLHSARLTALLPLSGARSHTPAHSRPRARARARRPRSLRARLAARR